MISTLTAVTEKELAEIGEEMRIRRTLEIFLLFSLGSQFDHLIAQCLARLGVYCLVTDPARITASDVWKIMPKGIILSGGPVSVYEDPPPFDCQIFDLGIPVLGICLGFQLWAQHAGRKVTKSQKREFNVHMLQLYDCHLFSGCKNPMPVLESHSDVVSPVGPPSGFEVLGFTEHAVAAGHYRHLWGVQFHPEVPETEQGMQILENFCFKICGAKDRFPAQNEAQKKIAELRQQIGDKKVMLLLSGGSDSSVAAHLLREAMADRLQNLKALYIKGIDRPDDEAHVRKYFSWLDVEYVDATEEFLAELAGKTSSHEKRVAVRKVYKEVAEEFIHKGGFDFVAQGTLYTDICESGLGYDTGAKKARIKLHHNVGLNFSVPELTPLDDQVKDTARNIGRSIGVPEELLTRHPFPGPGLVVRIEGEVTRQKLAISRQLNGIFDEEILKEGIYEKIWQPGVELTCSKSTCTKGDDQGMGFVVCLWGKSSVNGFTARPYRFDWDFMERVTRRMGNEVPGIGRVTVDTTGKPFATIEWE